MSLAIEYVKNQVKIYNRNFVGIFVGRVGTGKSWSCMTLSLKIDPTFNVDRIFFKAENLLDAVHKGELKPGEVVMLDEAGVSISNRQHYMNKFNMAMSQLLQTWRHRNHILFVTVPDIAFVDAGIRKMFDAIIECKDVVKSRNIVKADWKFIQVNAQSGKAYFHNLKSSEGDYRLEISKPPIKLINRYEKKKTEFTTELYGKLKDKLENENHKLEDKGDFRRCPICGLKGMWMPGIQKFKCRGCGNIYSKPKKSHTIAPKV